MASQTLARLLDRLEELKRPTGARDEARLWDVLSRLDGQRFTDAAPLIRFHEALLFLLAYPQSRRVLLAVKAALKTFGRRVRLLEEMGADMEPFADSEASGIVGTRLTAVFSYHLARWLALKHAAEVRIDWEGYEDAARLGETLPRFVPLLEEESLIEANVPYAKWLGAARPKIELEFAWLIKRFAALAVSEREKAELYNSLKLYLNWRPAGFRTTRTGMRFSARKTFYHKSPLLGRRDVSLVEELNAGPLTVERLSRREGARLLDRVRATSTIRYRELHGFTYGDAARVRRVHAGRGVEFLVNGVEAEHRLPLRAYTSAFMVKNGVPIGYVEGLSFCERMEIGFNIYYTFRDGESAWLYARVMRVFRQLLGVTAFSVDPYQIGFENEEGIASGAFWFYRKLGFRPVRADIESLTREEERKLKARPGYRTLPKTLRRMAEGHMLFELEPAAGRSWDRFQIRRLGLKVGRRMAEDYAGDALKMRRACLAEVAGALGVRTDGWQEQERRAFENLAPVLALIPNLARWTEDERKAVVSLVRAKAAAEETGYLRGLQSHRRLREALIRLGS